MYSKYIQVFGMLVLSLTLAGAGCSEQKLNFDPKNGQNYTSSAVKTEISAKDQQVELDKVLISRAAMPSDGWVVVSNYQNGKIGDEIGYAPALKGENYNITVTIDRSQITPSLVATLYFDSPKIGVYDKGDQPITNASGTISVLFSSRGVVSPVQIKSKPAK